MSFTKLLNQALREKHLTGKQLSELTGIPQTTISGYRNGASPCPANLDILEEVLELNTEADDDEPFTIEDAARLLEMPLPMLKLALKKEKFKPQFGIALQRESGQWAYYVFKERLEKYLKGYDFRQ